MIKVAFDPQLEAINRAYLNYFKNDHEIKFIFLDKPQWCSRKKYLPIRMICFFIVSFYQFAKGKYDIVHINSATLGFAAYLASFFRCRYIYTIHGAPHPAIENREGGRVAFMFWVSRHLMRFVARRAQEVYAISEFTRKELLTGYDISSKVIYNGVDIYNVSRNKIKLIKEKYNLDNKICFISVGRMIECKHPEDVVKIFNRVKTEQGNAFLIMIGNGILQNCVRSLVENLKLSDDVLFIDYVDFKDMPNWYKVADYFISGSEIEGFGLAALESVAYGCIPILPALGAFVEIFDKKYLYNRNEIDSFTLKKINKKTDKELAYLPYKYSWDNSLSQYKKEYKMLFDIK